jgi:hypothetical protein
LEKSSGKICRRHREDSLSSSSMPRRSPPAGRPAPPAPTPRASDIAPIIADIKATGTDSLREIAAGLNDRGIPTARGGEWSAVQVQRVMNRAAA